ncbi:hypothetical protein [Streptosporangium lutulentum]|uniref:Vacuolar-type H+-ATPase subunit I/STV1 n=1 Tax=Streptosporangium lutulentum TaxID=1461250 RepID=A0ABT9QGU1_9ACTN|nr:hypothetical protein [Streptosporangium lutulentum]MDP9845983.1 vacuolar-type H+-ATPase subunit I/STV1 [Streptosporangium lutulentum]
MTGLLIGAVFGTIFVAVNAHTPLNAAIGTLLRVVAFLCLAGVIVMWFLAVRRERTGGAQPSGVPGRSAKMFNRGYVLVVIGEVVLLFGGIAALRAWGRPEEANVAWIAFVVGVHFIALAPAWKQRSILLPGVALSLFGVAGLVLSATSALEWVPFVSGVLSGVTLLAGCTFFAWRGMPSQTVPSQVAGRP